MRYIYMNNFRGFVDTIIPLCQTNFMVGENSTGKSSFLFLLSLVNQPSFWINPSFSLRDDSSVYSYADLVSAWAEDKSTFEVGVVTTEREKSGKVRLSFNVHQFAECEDVPKLVGHIKIDDKTLTSVCFEKSRTKYKVSETNCIFDSEDEAISSFRGSLASLKESHRDYKFLPKGIPPNPPLPFISSILRSMKSGEDEYDMEFNFKIPMGMHVTWVAPIRTRPKRIYDGINIGYSSEGEHSPMLLKKHLRSRAGTKRFADRLKEFGDASGLFEMVEAHSFGKGAKNPFELVIKFKGADLNISNVGYGVSQALPLVVEFLTTDRKMVFAVQQPEVHLHPKAQAALGGLIFQLAQEKKHSFFIETHSDYLIDRYRLSMKNFEVPPVSQMLFFMRTDSGNQVHALPISKSGLYPREQPKEFREFFVKEELSMLGV